MSDPVIAEVWRNRDALAARYGNNLEAIVEAIRKKHPRKQTPVRVNGRSRKRRAA